MPEITRCPQCQRQLRVPDNLIGQSVKCPGCGLQFTASVAGPAEPPPLPPVPPLPNIPAPPAASEGFTAPPVPGADFGGGQPWQQQQQSSGYGYDYPRRDGAPHRGTMILVFGILSLVVCGPIFGPMAWIMGNSDLEEIRSGRMDREGEGLTQAGRICGIIGSIIAAFQLLLCCLWGMVIAGAGAAGGR